jgi:hypothetical protein
MWNSNRPTRRRWLSYASTIPGIIATGATSVIGDTTQPSSGPHHPGKVKSVIFYYCKGGPSQAHTFDRPKRIDDDSLHPFGFSRCGQSGLEISDLFPSLQRVADELCLIRSGYGALATHHEGGIHIFTSASKVGASLGAWMLHGLGSANPSLPGYVLLTGRTPGDKWAVDGGSVHGGARSVGTGGLPPSLQAQVIRDLETPIADLDSPLDRVRQEVWLNQLQALNQSFTSRHPELAELPARSEAFATAYRMQTAAPEAFDLAQESNQPAMRRLYGLDEPATCSTGTKLLLARRLVERGVRFIVVPSMNVPSREAGSGDWDTHTPAQVRGLMPNLAQACDQPLAGLIADLKQRSLLDSTLVIWGGEMGRGGSGHMNHNGNAFSWWMAGGGVRPGYTYGSTDDQGFTAVEKPIHVRDLHATILWMCGLDFRRLEHHGIGFDTTCQVAHELIA